MRFLYFLLLVAASFVTTTEAVNENQRPEVASISNGRSLRVEDDTSEERATIFLDGVLKDKAATNALLTKWLREGETLQQVSKRLKVLDMSSDVARFSPNWAAAVKYQRMRYTEMTGKVLPYAKFGGSLRTESETKEAIMKWVMSGTSKRDAAISLGVAGLSKGELIVHQNYKAYKLFKKYQKQWNELQASLN